MGYLWLFALPFTTRMTVIRLPEGGLWVHSPTPLDDALKAEIDALGPVAHIVAPNRIHYWWAGDWKQAYPQARTYAAPKVVAEAASGEEAVTCAQQLQLDIVLMDLRLPGINGLTAAATIKSDRPEIIILMLSGDWSAAHDRRAKAAGIRARIAKQQFNLAEIYRALVTDSD